MVTPADRGLRERRFIAGARPASPFVFACPTLARRCSRLAVSRACAGKHCFANLFRGEPTAHARLGEQEARARRIGLELVPQLLHVDAQVMRLVDIERAPCFAQKVPVRQHHAGMRARRAGRSPPRSRYNPPRSAGCEESAGSAARPPRSGSGVRRCSEIRWTELWLSRHNAPCMSKPLRKPIKWVGSAKRDLDAMPDQRSPQSCETGFRGWASSIRSM